MYKQYDYYAIVIGSGAAGLTVAKGLAKAGKKVLLIEKGPYGGDSINYGSIPSKALIASANMAHELWRSGVYGIDIRISNFQPDRVLDRVRSVVEEARVKNSPSFLKKQGIDTCLSACSFVDSHTVQVKGANGDVKKISAKTIVIATGSTPKVASIRGLDEISYHTNETIFGITEIPSTLVVIGGGVTGCEFAQAFRRLGSSVTIIEQSDHFLSGEEPKAYKAIQSALIKEDIEIYIGSQVTRVRKDGDRIALHVKRKGEEREYDIKAQQVLFAIGRKPENAGLALEAAGVDYSAKGIERDQYGRTSQPHIWVVGALSGDDTYTSSAISDARTVMLNILTPWPLKKKLDNKRLIPRVVYTDPQMASIGLTEQEAIELYGAANIATYEVALAESDKALCQSQTDGFVKIVTKRLCSRILGATLVAPNAADMLLELSVAMQNDVPLRNLSTIIHPYPTNSQIIEKAAEECFSAGIFSRFLKIFR